MSRRCLGVLLLSSCWAALVPAGPAAEPPKPDRPDATAAARRAWAATDLILAHHLEPPPRQEMLLSGVRALLRKADVTPPASLRDRLARVTNAEQWAAVVRDVWPQEDAAEELSDALLQGLLPVDARQRLSAAIEVLQYALLPGPLRLRPVVQDLPFGGDRLIRAADLKVQEQLTQNRYVGTGIQIRRDDKADCVMIVLAIPGGPARRAGARAGDLIVEVDGVSMRGKKVQELVAALRGGEGTDVTMVVRQPDAAETRTLRMTRSVVPFETAVGFRRTGEQSWQYRPDPKAPVAYVRLTAVKVSTLQELRRIERQLRADGAKALVLDLRGCADVGDLAYAAQVADGLLDGGLLWRVRGARGQVKEQHADRDCLFRGWPMAVLVNGATQGTGILALTAALQDNRRAVVVGQPTPWAGTVRSLIPLPDGQGSLVLTTGVLERPAAAREPAVGTAKRLWGVQPDHLVVPDGKQAVDVMAWHRAQESPDAPNANTRPPDDSQLAKAIELLKAALDGQDHTQLTR
jgi:carboxyl-terminal processing protease